MNLTAEEIRVLCVLVEKSFTTPDQYPLTTNALVLGCNQRTSRDPVVSYTASEVDATMQSLRASGWARTVRMTGSRTDKHKHVVVEQLPLSDSQLAILAVLGLRGAQSPGELKTRTERYVEFEAFSDVVADLHAMSAMTEPLVRNVGTSVGQSQDRWIQLLSPAGEVLSGAEANPTTEANPSTEANPTTEAQPADRLASAEPAGSRPTPRVIVSDAGVSRDGPGGPSGNLADTVERLQQQVAALQRRVEALERSRPAES